MTQSLPETSHDSCILVIGGANMDIVGFPDAPLIYHDSNPGKIKMSLGGVGRNIAENLARLGASTTLLAAIGDDVYGEKIRRETAAAGVNTNHLLTFTEHRSSTYFCMLDHDDDMALALADMSIVDAISPQHILEQAVLIREACAVVLDTNLSQEALSAVLTQFPEQRFLVDPVSVTKAQRLEGLLAHIDTLKPNRLEAQALTGIEITSSERAALAIEKLCSLGVTQVYMSLGKEGVAYGSASGYHLCPAQPTEIVNATGAGDAMMAAIAFGTQQHWAAPQILPFAAATAALTLTADSTIHPDMSQKRVAELLEKSIDAR